MCFSARRNEGWAMDGWCLDGDFDKVNRRARDV